MHYGEEDMNGEEGANTVVLHVFIFGWHLWCNVFAKALITVIASVSVVFVLQIYLPKSELVL